MMLGIIRRKVGSMRGANAVPNQFTFALILAACAKMMAVGLGRQVHCCLIKLGFLTSFESKLVNSLLISLCNRCWTSSG
jgi:hypothetical protein